MPNLCGDVCQIPAQQVHQPPAGDKDRIADTESSRCCIQNAHLEAHAIILHGLHNFCASSLFSLEEGCDRLHPVLESGEKAHLDWVACCVQIRQ